ncbi:hypothetical protein GAYE_SCF38G5203 [Galdieria yellowstonensis]|uniref:Uncharacterized protein n=1 Tax=Galdieria yellowstonensis TaxID=3028027 RepID=A0AAV9IJB7_9RHOD|nr:hypothetical protein GAYE_SCF38G5203 [Galdieria yellowstonensis]
MQNNNESNPPKRYPFEDEWREKLNRKMKQEKIARQVMSQVQELRWKESLEGYIENEVEHIRNHVSNNFRYHQPQIMNKGVETAKRVSGNSVASWNKQFLQLIEASNSMRKDIAEDNRKLNSLVLKYKKRKAQDLPTTNSIISTKSSSSLNGTSEIVYPVGGMSPWKLFPYGAFIENFVHCNEYLLHGFLYLETNQRVETETAMKRNSVDKKNHKNISCTVMIGFCK